MKICVYTIAKNEAKHVERWCKSNVDADYRFVLDTGSTDNTVEMLQAHGVPVETQLFTPFRFDHARQAALDRLPADIDVCVSLDMDEILTPGWRRKIEAAWTPMINRMNYNFVWSFDNLGRPDLEFLASKIHGRHTHYWRYAVHEIPYPLVGENRAQCNDTIIEQHRDGTKSRAQYVAMVEAAAIEAPDCAHISHHLGKEYFCHGRFEDAIREMQRYLDLPEATWIDERCFSMGHVAKAHMAQGNGMEAEKWFQLAVAEDPSSREAVINLAACLLGNGKAERAKQLGLSALQMHSSSRFMRQSYAQNEGAYDVVALASFCMGAGDDALHYGRMALDLNNVDPRLHSLIALYAVGPATILEQIQQRSVTDTQLDQVT